MIACVSGHLWVDNFFVDSGELGWGGENCTDFFKTKNKHTFFWVIGQVVRVPGTAEFGAQILESVGHQTQWNQNYLGAFTPICQ